MVYLKTDLESGRPHDLRPSQMVGAATHTIILISLRTVETRCRGTPRYVLSASNRDVITERLSDMVEEVKFP